MEGTKNKLLFYNLQNTFKKICIFLRQVKITIGKDGISAKIVFRIACDQLKV